MKLMFLYILMFFMLSCNAAVENDRVENLPAGEINEYINGNGEEMLIIDIRTPNEYHAGHLSKAINVDFYSDQFWDEFNRITANTDSFVLYCASGNRSGQVISRFVQNYDGKIIHMRNGINDWNANRLPVNN